MPTLIQTPQTVTPLAAMPAARAALARIPFVGRGSELARLAQRLAEAGQARGGLLMLVGEAGIGKTRTAEVFCAAARDAGALTLWGRCDEGGWAPPFEPFRAMLVAYAEQTDRDTLRAALGAGANVLAGLAPYLQRRLPDLPALLPLGPDESRLRLFDAVTQFLLACSAARPVVLVLDDLHWADAGTIALLRYTARYASAHRLLLVGTYRDAAIEMGAPLAEALAALRHDTCFERLALRPLDRGAIADLLAQLGGGVAAEVVAAVDTAGEGNPFFIRELLLDLLETGCIAPRPEGWCFDLSAQRGRVPEGIRDLVRRRLARLSPAARRLLDVAAFLGDGFRFDLAAAVAGLEQGVALAALDEALAAQIVRPGPDGDAYEFVHAMLRQTLYAEPSPSRRLRQHRDIAEALERLADASAGDAHAAAIAHQYHRSAALPGAERGVPYAVAASERAAATGAHDEVACQVQIALALLPAGDARRPRLLANLGLALAWARAGEVAVRTIREAGEQLAAGEGADAAADFLAEALRVLAVAGVPSAGAAVAARGLALVGARRDATWMWLRIFDIHDRQATDPRDLGILIESDECAEVRAVADRLDIAPADRLLLLTRGFFSPTVGDEGPPTLRAIRLLFLGPLAQRRFAWESYATLAEQSGQLATAAMAWASVARLQAAAGELAAHSAFERAAALAGRAMTSSLPAMLIEAAHYDITRFRGEGGAALLEAATGLTDAALDIQWNVALRRASAASLAAEVGRIDQALELFALVLPALEHGSRHFYYYPLIAFEAAATLWTLERRADAERLEHCVREKALASPAQHPGRDAHLALARLCALQERWSEASDWFQRARHSVQALGARSLRAIVDFDEALMFVRRGAGGDAARAAPLLDRALDQFRAIGMAGWVARAEALAADLAAPARGAAPSPAISLRDEGAHWTIAYDGMAVRLRAGLGLHYLATLLAHPGEPIAARELMAVVHARGAAPQRAAATPELRRAGDLGHAGELLDATARRAYRTRLAELEGEIEEAEAFNDTGRCERLATERDALTEQLAAAFGLGGRPRRAADAGERVRLAVTKRLKAVLRQLRAVHPALGRHLAATVHTGALCIYQPAPAAAPACARPARSSR